MRKCSYEEWAARAFTTRRRRVAGRYAACRSVRGRSDGAARLVSFLSDPVSNLQRTPFDIAANSRCSLEQPRLLVSYGTLANAGFPTRLSPCSRAPGRYLLRLAHCRTDSSPGTRTRTSKPRSRSRVLAFGALTWRGPVYLRGSPRVGPQAKHVAARPPRRVPWGKSTVTTTETHTRQKSRWSTN